MKKFYFDIDGVLLNLDPETDEDIQRPLLCGGNLQNRLDGLFDEIFCVSGWTDMTNTFFFPIEIDKKKEYIWNKLNNIFTREFMFDKVELTYDNQNRCQWIDPQSNFYFVDDFADEFWIKQYGYESYKYHLETTHRILLSKPDDNGKELLDWLKVVAVH